MPKALVFYHYFHPDDVVSAQHFAGLCLGLKERGWDITAMPCNRGCRDESNTYPAVSDWNGIEISRVWRPRFRQASHTGRILNSLWMLAAWSLATFRHRPDVLIVGSEPLFSVLTALPWRLLRPRTRIVHWCFDLYPEAAIADGLVSSRNPIVRVLRAVLRAAYRRCDLVGSLGVCMTRLLETYVPTGRIRVYTPWALEEPDVPLSTDLAERQLIFGNAALALMYSGNFGRAHAYEEILALARELKGTNTVVSFSIRGNCAGAVYAAVHPEDSNLNFVDFAPQDRLEQRLGAPDVHLVSLKEAYLGTVVPSKFQGALAAGRPVLFAGPPDSAVARWIDEFGLGWNLTLDNARPIAASLGAWQADPAARKAMNEHCFEAYHRHFSKTAILDAMDKDMRDLLARAPEDPVARSPAGAR